MQMPFLYKYLSLIRRKLFLLHTFERKQEKREEKRNAKKQKRKKETDHDHHTHHTESNG